MHISKSTRQTFILYASTLLGVAFGVVASVINTKFMSPTDYGDVRYVQNILQFASSLLLFGYFLSGSRLLALSDNEDESRKIRGCMVLILAATAIIMFLITAGCAVAHYNRPIIAKLFVVSLPVCIYPILLNYINTTAQGDNHIGRLSAARLVPSLLYIPLAYLIYSVYGATSTRMILIQWGLYTIVLLALTISTKPIFKDIKRIFHNLSAENRDYGFQLYIGSLVMVATNYLAGISLGVFNSDNTEVGFYTLALTVTGPLAMLPSIIGTTYFKEFAKLDKIPSSVMRNTLIITTISCVLFILLIKQFVVLLYTEEYATVGVYASWLSVGYCIHGFGDMLNRYLGSHGQGRDIRNASIANGVVKVFGYTLFVYLWNTPGALFTTILCDFIYTAMILWYYVKFVKSRERVVNI